MPHSKVQVKRGGELVWESQTLEHFRRRLCLCESCEKYAPGVDMNCPIAIQLGAVCRQGFNVIAMARCRYWVERDAET